MKWLLPYTAFSLRTRLKPYEIARKLAEETEPLDIGRFLWSAHNFPMPPRQISLSKYFEG